MNTKVFPTVQAQDMALRALLEDKVNFYNVRGMRSSAVLVQLLNPTVGIDWMIVMT